MGETITVRELSRPKLTRVLKKSFRDLSDETGDPVDITGYAFKFIVKHNLELPDSRAYFDLAGVIESAADGIYSFTLTHEHTCLPPGTYPGEVRWWNDGVTSKPPSDAISVNYVVEPAVDKTV